MVRLVTRLLIFLCKVVRALGLSVGNYQATLTIEGFKGVMQYAEDGALNTDMRYASAAKNCDTRDGALMPVAVPVVTTPAIPSVTGSAGLLVLPQENAYYNFGTHVIVASGTEDVEGEDPRYVMYMFTPGRDNSQVVPLSEMYPSIVFPPVLRHSFAQYEYEDGEYMDAIFFSNPGYAPWRISVLRESQGIGVQQQDTPYNFSVLARYGERIWGAGAPEAPEIICYSRPYQPNDWSQDTEIPEDGGGEIRQPTFDGEGFTALVPFGNSLLAFKEHSLWRITGMSPDEFTFQEQYGTGTIFPHTVCVYQEAVYFLTDRGMYRYDGATVRPFQPHALQVLWRDHPLAGIDTHMPTAVVWRDRYILSFPDTREATYNNRTVVYNFADGTWGYADKGLNATAYIVARNKLFLLQPTTEGTTNVAEWHGSIEETETEAIEDVTEFDGFDWTTPWSDMGAKDILKNEFKLRFWIQTHMAGDRLKLAVTVETERGSKTREIIFDRDVDEEIKMRFHLSGRKVRMRFKLTDREGNEQITSWCKIMGGMQLNADTSPD